MKKSVLLLALIGFFAVSCSPRYGEEPQPAPISQPESSSAEGETEEMQPSNYYDFSDILIPQEMKLDADASLLFETTNLKAGRICFKGWVDPVSLFSFFKENMPRDQWKLRSYFKYGVYMLVFEKPDRDCIISIHKRAFSTWLEVWVTPRLVQAQPE